jgi:hypothetical protein
VNWDAVIAFLKDQGPALVALMYFYMQGQTIRAQQETAKVKLEDEIKENHEKVQQQLAGLSDADIVNQAASGSAAQPGGNQKSG